MKHICITVGCHRVATKPEYGGLTVFCPPCSNALDRGKRIGEQTRADLLKKAEAARDWIDAQIMSANEPPDHDTTVVHVELQVAIAKARP